MVITTLRTVRPMAKAEMLMHPTGCSLGRYGSILHSAVERIPASVVSLFRSFDQRLHGSDPGR